MDCLFVNGCFEFHTKTKLQSEKACCFWILQTPERKLNCNQRRLICYSILQTTEKKCYIAIREGQFVTEYFRLQTKNRLQWKKAFSLLTTSGYRQKATYQSEIACLLLNTSDSRQRTKLQSQRVCFLLDTLDCRQKIKPQSERACCY